MSDLPSFLSTDALPALETRDIETLRHMLKAGMGKSTLRAIASDMSYIEAWHRAGAQDGSGLSWPPQTDVLLKFVAHHLFDRGQRVRDERHGMPEDVERELRAYGVLRAELPHSPATVRRRLSSWKTMCLWQNVVTDAFDDPKYRKVLALSVKSQARRRTRKSKNPITSDDVMEIAASLTHWCVSPENEAAEYKARCLAALRDRAMIGLGFASGGRRRSEIANLRVDMLEPTKQHFDRRQNHPAVDDPPEMPKPTSL